MKKSTSTVIEFTETHVKLIQSKWQRGRGVLSLLACREISGGDHQIAQTVSSLIGDKRSEAGKDLTVIIPRRFVILRQLTLPSRSEEELRRMVGLQIVGEVPYAREDIIFDCYSIEKDISGYTKVLVAVVPREVVDKYLRILKKSGLVPHKITISALGMLGWFLEYQHKKNQNKGVPAALIHMDATHSEICFVQDEKMLFSRSVPQGFQEIMSAEDEFMEQVGLTFGAYKKDAMGEKIEMIAVLSAQKPAETLKKKLQEYYQVPVEEEEPGDVMFCEKEFKAALAQTGSISVVPGAGILSGEIHQSFNLMPPELLDTRLRRARRRKALQLFLALWIFVGAIAGALVLSIYENTVKLEKLRQAMVQTEESSTQAKEKAQFIEFIREELSRRIFLADVMTELYRIVPDEISFLSIALDNKNILTIQGFADTGTRVNDFQNLLVSSPLFQEVSLQFATKRKRFREEYVDFKIICQLASEHRL